MNFARPTIALLAACALVAAGPAPHPGHSSYAEVSHDNVRGELQVSLGMLAIDFEKTLSQRTGKRVNLDKTKGIDKIIETYLADRFAVTLADGSKPSPHFAGREDMGKNVWIYFTVPLAPKQAKKPAQGEHDGAGPDDLLTGVVLRNRVLMELNAEQRNLVELRDGKRRRMLTFTRKNQVQPLRSAEPVKNGKRKLLVHPSK